MSALPFPIGTMADVKAALTAGARRAPVSDDAFSGELARAAALIQASGQPDSVSDKEGSPPAFWGFDVLKASFRNDDGLDTGANTPPMRDATGTSNSPVALDVVTWAKSSALPDSRPVVELAQAATATAPCLPGPEPFVQAADAGSNAADAAILKSVAERTAAANDGKPAQQPTSISQAYAGQEPSQEPSQHTGKRDGSAVPSLPKPAMGKALQRTVQPAPEQPVAPVPSLAPAPQAGVLDGGTARIEEASASAGADAKPPVVAAASPAAEPALRKPGPGTMPVASEPESVSMAALPAASTSPAMPDSTAEPARHLSAMSPASSPRPVVSAAAAPARAAANQAPMDQGRPTGDPTDNGAPATTVPVQAVAGPITAGRANRKAAAPASPQTATSSETTTTAGPRRPATPRLDEDAPAVSATAPLETTRSRAVEPDAPATTETPVQQVVAALRSMAQEAPSGPRQPGDDAPAAGAPTAEAASKPGLAPPPLANRQVTIQLNPEHLGSVSITLRLSARTIDVRIAVANEQTLNLLDKDRHLLSAAVEAAGGTADALALVSAAPMPTVPSSTTAGHDQARPDTSRQQGFPSAASSGGNGERGTRAAPSPSNTVPEDDHAILPASRQSRVGDDLYL